MILSSSQRASSVIFLVALHCTVLCIGKGIILDYDYKAIIPHACRKSSSRESVFSKEASSIFRTKSGKLELDKKNKEYSLPVA
jgi:hypothetical protein